MEELVFVCGHRNPDTDSIVSTIAYSYLKNQMGINASPVRIGNINSETSYILRKFNIMAPPLQFDIRTRVCDIQIDEAFTVGPEDTIETAWKIMREHDKKVIGIVDEKRRILGVTTVSGITNALLASSLQNYELIKKIPLEYIAKTLKGEIIVNPRNYHPNGVIKITSNTAIETGEMAYQDVCVIASSRSSSHMYAIEHGASLLVVTQASDVEPEVLIAATKANCAIICTPLDLYIASQNICAAIPVKDIMTTELVSFGYYDYLDDVKAIIPNSRYRSYPVIDDDGVLMGFISRYHLWNHEKRKIILVDHNEIAQSIDGVEEADVVEIVDHHKVGDIQTSMPIVFRNEIVGSTSTIISKIYEENKVEMPKEIAGLLCGAIISDTLNFNSPTCTNQDREMARKLAEKAGLDLEEYANEIITAGSSLSGKGISEIVHNDLKEFVMDSFRIVIGQINVIDPEYIYEIKDSMTEFLEGFCVANHYDMALMIFTDIEARGSYMICAGKDQYLATLAFEDQINNINGISYVDGLMSRKKQVIPALSKAVNAYSRK